jgi:hypothetical protein
MPTQYNRQLGRRERELVDMRAELLKKTTDLTAIQVATKKR